MEQRPDIKWRTETPTEKQYNGMQVIARHLSWHNEGDDQNPTPWTKINTQYFFGSIIDNDIHIERDDRENDDVALYLDIVTDQTTPLEVHHHYSEYVEHCIDIIINQHQFFYDDGNKTHQWQWALLEG
jgi:hypothetical protein